MHNQTNKYSLSVGTLIAAAALTFGAANALSADTLTVIPTMGTDTSNEGRAITSDGLFVVGLSGTANGFLYSVANNTVIQPNAVGMVPSIATGVGYRTDGGQQQLVIDGWTGSGQADWMTSDGGLTWGAKRRNTSFNTAYQPPTANSLGAAPGSDAFYTTFRTTDKHNLYVNKGSGTWNGSTAPTFTTSVKGISADNGVINGVSATGRGVGQRAANNYMLDYNGTGTPTPNNFNGLNGTIAGQAFSVSANGNTIFGQSPITVGGTTFYGYKATMSGTTETSIGALPLFGNEAGSVSLQVPYGASADGVWAVGMDYRGLEKAVVWNTSDANPANWVPFDLTDLAAADGVLGSYTRLSRAYSVGEDGLGDLVITGIGVNGGATSAFVMTIPMSEVPEPGTLSLLALGLFGLLALRRRK